MINTYIPFLKDKDKSNLLNCIRTNFVSTAGPLVGKFEYEFCKKFNFKYAVAVNSGTSALHLALKIHDIGQNDIVALPSYTFAATANTIRYNNAEPWFFDCDRDLILDLNKLNKSLEKNNLNSKKKNFKKRKNKLQQ